MQLKRVVLYTSSLICKLSQAIEQQNNGNAHASAKRNMKPCVVANRDAIEVMSWGILSPWAAPARNVEKICAPPGHTHNSHVSEQNIQYLNRKVVPPISRFAVRSRTTHALPAHEQKEKESAVHNHQKYDNNAEYLKERAI